jgi:hypothetical protein
LRREEQRRKQAAAANTKELSAKIFDGESSNKDKDSNSNNKNKKIKQHKHPLNSERRRANRRKPKWLKRPTPVSNVGA